MGLKMKKISGKELEKKIKEKKTKNVHLINQYQFLCLSNIVEIITILISDEVWYR